MPTQSDEQVNERNGLGEGGLADVVRQIAERVTNLLRLEVELARVELQTRAKRLTVGAGLLAAAALLGFFAFPFALTTIILAIAAGTAWWLTTLIITALLIAGSVTLGLLGLKSLKKGIPVPRQALSEAQLTKERLRGR
jgi:uncharacterized membrane protein YqjE